MKIQKIKILKVVDLRQNIQNFFSDTNSIRKVCNMKMEIIEGVKVS